VNSMEELVYFYPRGHAAHFENGHPERPERVEAIRNALQARGWWDAYPQLTPLELPQRVLGAIHSPQHLQAVQFTSLHAEHFDFDTYTTPSSWSLALSAAGGAAAVAGQVWRRDARRGYALTRPPGHHATRNQSMGFCLLNNVALAAEWLFQQAGANRLAIVDLDLHHGNGTQDIFWERGDVLYISTHQSPLYPGTGALQEIGMGAGAGANANFPLPPGAGDRAFLTVMDGLILPLLERFDPEMLLVSVGYDTHWRDPLGSLQLSALGYSRLIAKLAGYADDHCQGRIALFLEGGYDLEAGAACGQGNVAALLGQPWQDPLGSAPGPESDSWQKMVLKAEQIWGLK
jgi:acetoin utilization deacetylase AcuC-like enzyme